MKKVLFATTALILSAGFAHAEVAVGGDGRMGIVYDGNDAQFSSRVRVEFTLTGESDSGLSFGGSTRVDHMNGGAEGNAGEVWVSGAFGKLTMGDIDSAAENAIGDLTEIGYTGLGFHNEFVYTSSDDESAGDPGALYSYSVGDANVYVSMMDSNDQESYSVGANYKFGNSLVGIGYERNKSYDVAADATIERNLLSAGAGVGTWDTKTWVIGGASTFGAATVKAGYAQTEVDGVADKFKQIGVGVDYAMGPTTVSGFVRQEKLGDLKAQYVGIGAEYDLGGGASVKGGIVDIDQSDVGGIDDTVADLGLKFKF